MIRFLFCLSVLFYVGVAHAQNSIGTDGNDQQEISYDFPTNLSGGYKLVFKTKRNDQYIYLTKDNKIITTLSSQSGGLPLKNLGYLAADFGHGFVFAQSFGAGNPHHIELINKATGRNLISANSYWIDAKEEKGFLLYSEHGVPIEKDKMIGYFTVTGRKLYFQFPLDIFGEPMILNRINIISLTNKELNIEYWTNGERKTKTYNLN